MGCLIDLVGKVFGRLVVIGRAPNIGKKTMYYCQCACGKQCCISAANLRKGATQSCHCIQREMMRGRRKVLRRLEHKMWLRARFRAKLAGLPFSLDENDIQIPDKCPVLGIPISRIINKRDMNRDSSPTLDRLVNEKGYVPGNVFVISSRANRIKNDATPEELMAVWRYAVQEQNNV